MNPLAYHLNCLPLPGLLTCFDEGLGAGPKSRALGPNLATGIHLRLLYPTLQVELSSSNQDNMAHKA